MSLDQYDQFRLISCLRLLWLWLTG